MHSSINKVYVYCYAQNVMYNFKTIVVQLMDQKTKKGVNS